MCEDTLSSAIDTMEQMQIEIDALTKKRDELIDDKVALIQDKARLHKLLDNNNVKAKLNTGDMLTGLDRVGFLIKEKIYLTSRVAELEEKLKQPPKVLCKARCAEIDEGNGILIDRIKELEEVIEKVRVLAEEWYSLGYDRLENERLLEALPKPQEEKNREDSK